MNFPKTIHTVVLGTAFIGGLVLTGCSETPQEQQDEMNKKMEGVHEEMDEATAADTYSEWTNERNDVLVKLRNMRDDIDKELARTNERLAGKDLKPSERTDEEAMKAELMREKTRVQELITNVEGSDQSTWATVKEATRETTSDIEAWWLRLKDNIDKTTDSDKDHDGK